MAGISRRTFVRTSALAGVATGLAGERLLGQAPAVRSNSARPVVIASGNGNRFKNGGDRTCVEEAFRLLVGGTDPLDAVIAGVNIVERDPEDTSVGYGGLPNADGIVQLDSCCMHGPKKRAGGVAALEGVRTPSLVAKAVMEQTDHHLLVGTGAQTFARNMGFEIEADLNTAAFASVVARMETSNRSVALSGPARSAPPLDSKLACRWLPKGSSTQNISTGPSTATACLHAESLPE